LFKSVFTNPPINSLYNLEDDKGDLLLPLIYNDFYNESKDRLLFSLGKFGIQCIDLYNKKGKLLCEDAYWINFHSGNYIEIWDQHSKIKIFRYRTAEADLEFLGEPRGHFLERVISFFESRFYFNGGFVDQNFLSTSPNCFDNAKFFSEGLAPVCLNGRWGYSNKQSEIVIDCIYGNAAPFNNGTARVFVLKPEYQSEKGIWIDTDRFWGYTQIDFLTLFPEFPQKVRKPLCFLRGNTKTSDELNEEYHYYADGVEDKHGSWCIINTKGVIQDEIHLLAEDEEMKTPDQIDSEYWFDYIIENSEKLNIVNELPDILFINKPFVLRVLEQQPLLFSHFSVFYADDDDIAEVVLRLPYKNYNLLSERLRLHYQETYNQLLLEDDQSIFKDEQQLEQNLSDDLPL
jgi:hypothetical protein